MNAVRFGETPLKLMEGKRFGKDVEESSVARIETLPETALFAAVLAQPLFAGGSGAAGAGLGWRWSGLEWAADHWNGDWGLAPLSGLAYIYHSPLEF